MLLKRMLFFAGFAVIMVSATGALCFPSGSVDLDNEIRKLDDCKDALAELGKKVNTDLENNLQSPNQTTLRDLVYFCRVAVIELHYYVDLYVLSRSRGTDKTFRMDKVEELRKKGGDILFDLKKRMRYVSLDDPVHEEELIKNYRSKIETELKKAVGALESISKKLEQAGA